MKKLLSFLPTHFTICLIVGIVIQFYYRLWMLTKQQSFILWVVFLLILFVSKRLNKKAFFTILSWILFLIFGMFLVYTKDTSNGKRHYSNFIEENQQVVLKVDKKLKSNLYYHKYLGTVIKVDQQNATGTILLNFQKDSFQTSLSVGETLLFSSKFQSVNKPLNPYQFNYKKYLERQGVYHQVFLKNNEWKKAQSKGFSLNRYAEDFRRRVEKSLFKNKIEGEELAVIKALLLGQRNDISKELLENYTRAGAIHILAVSGLHVGIILLILSFLFKPIEKLKFGKTIKTVLILILLWSFAIIAGLSASVVRAVMMFSAIAIGMGFERKSLVLHSLITSMFILLLIKPMFVFDVGFQLSYLAVFSIVTIQPKLVSLWKPKWVLLNKIWQLTTVSIAAQIGVLPLSLCYFHQFPSLFIVSNLVIVPFIGFILLFGIIVVVMALLNFLPSLIAQIYRFIIYLLNNFVVWVSEKEAFLITEISFSFQKMIIAYLLIFTVFYYLETLSKRLISTFLFLLIVFQFNSIFEKYKINTAQEFVVFHKSRNTVLGINLNEKLKVFHSLDSLQKINLIKNYKIGKGIKKIFYSEVIPNTFKIQNQQILIVDSDGIYEVDNFKNGIIVLIQSPKINLERLITILQPKLIIADGSNYKSYTTYWRSISNKNKIPFYDTRESGAFVLR